MITTERVRELNNILLKRGLDFDDLRIIEKEPEYVLRGIREAIELLQKCKGTNVGVLFDTDADGLGAGRILVKMLNRLGIYCDYIINDGKEHGISKKAIGWAEETGLELLFVVDAGTGDREQQKYLNSLGVNVIILDHHEVCDLYEGYIFEDETSGAKTVIVNCEYEGSPNRDLSGCGVTYKFIKELVNSKEYKEVNFNIDDLKVWVGMTILSDMCCMLNKENRYFVNYALKNYSKFEIFKYFEHYGSVSNMLVFKVIPHLNALIRMDKGNIAMELVLSDSPSQVVKYMRLAEEAIKIQKQLVEEAIESVKMIKAKQVLIVRLADDKRFFNLTGLIANKLLEKEKVRSCIVVYKDDMGVYKGSFRSSGEINKSYLKSLGIWVKGHELACGVKFDGEDEFRSGINQLKEIDLGDETQAEFEPDLIINSEDVPSYRGLLSSLAYWNELSGTNFPKFVVYIRVMLENVKTRIYKTVVRSKFGSLILVDFDVEMFLAELGDNITQDKYYSLINSEDKYALGSNRNFFGKASQNLIEERTDSWENSFMCIPCLQNDSFVVIRERF